ncbi:MAG: hypothetical protein HY279_03050 [Nitrospinae bacterium]|nr:hypothetical protein [Nitrospinota bacterium]
MKKTEARGKKQEARSQKQESLASCLLPLASCFLLLASCLLPPVAAWAEDTCISCHRESAEERVKVSISEWEKSIHKIEKVKCHDCHGGDPESKEGSGAHKVNFIGKPARADIPKFCGRCHIRPLNDYRKSKHERLLSVKKEDGGATCIDCHGYHRIKTKKDTESLTYYLNVPQTCSRCHSDPARMKPFDMPTNQFELYEKGTHGAILYGKVQEVSRTSAPNCAVCHGHHDSMISTHQDIPRICGKCHLSTFDNFKEGLHFDALKKSGEPSCAYCHGNHKVIRPKGEVFAGFKKGECGECHEKSSEEFKVGLNIQGSIERLESLRREAKNSIEDVKKYGRNTADLEQLYTELNANILMIAPASHSLDLDGINKYVDKISTISEDIKRKVDEFKMEIRHRYVVYVISMIIILTAVIILFTQLLIYKKSEA